MQLQSASRVPTDQAISFFVKPTVIPIVFVGVEGVEKLGSVSLHNSYMPNFGADNLRQNVSSQVSYDFPNLYSPTVSCGVEEIEAGYQKIEVEIFNTSLGLTRASQDEPVEIPAVSLAQKVHSLCSNGSDKAEDKAVDLLFDFFVDNIAESNYSLVDDGLKCLSPTQMSDTCLLTTMHLTDQCKDYLTARKHFYEQAYQIIEKNNGKDIASELLDDLR